MAFLHSALCIFQSVLGLASRRGRSHGGTDWLKLALAVAAQPEDDESRSIVRTALQANNQQFLDYLRSALDTRSAAAARVAEINGDGVECRAFLPGSPALWGWTTNIAAEAAVLQAGIESAMESSIFDSPAASSSQGNEDVFVSTNSSEAMGGATLRDVYARAWEIYREPLIWTPRGPGAGVGASTWTLTPVSLILPSTQTRNRRASDASDARSSVVGLSPCLFTQRSRARRDSLQDVFTNADAKQKGLASPLVETGMVTPSPLLGAVALPPLDLGLSESRHRRSASCTRSHVSCTTATVSECSTPREQHAFELSFGGSTRSHTSTPSEIYSGDNEAEKEMVSKGRKMSYHLLGRQGRAPGSVVSRRNEVFGASVDNSKQFKLRRPGITPLQRVQASLSRRVHTAHGLTRTVSVSRTSGHGSLRGSRIGEIITSTQPALSSSPRDKFASLRRVRSAAVMVLSSSPQFPSMATPKVPLLGPVPLAKQVLNKHYARNSLSATVEGHSFEDELHDGQGGSMRRSSSRARRIVSTPATQRVNNAALSTPGVARSRIPRLTGPVAPVTPCAQEPSVWVTSSSKPKPRQLLTPTSMTRARERASSSRFPRSKMGSIRARSQTGGSMQERPIIARDRRHSGAYMTGSSGSVVVQRSNSAASMPGMIDRWDMMEESFGTSVFA